MSAFAVVVLLGLFAALASPVAAQNPSTDATLSGLALSEGRLDPVFATGTSDYAAAAGYTVTRITVVPTTTDASATVAYLDGGDMPLTDANTAMEEHDVDLVVGENVIKVRVTAEDNLAMETYTVTITRMEEDTSLSPLAIDPVAAAPVDGRLHGDVPGRLDHQRDTGRRSQRRTLLTTDRRRSQRRRQLC